jgi:hypothetical protein
VGATRIMIIRHAEKPGVYNGQTYFGVNAEGTASGKYGAKELITLGWARAGALVTLFAPPWGPKATLATPQALFGSSPGDSSDGDNNSNPSQRPYETLTPLAAALGSNGQALPINKSFSKKQYDKMVTAALACNGPVLVCWQQEGIPAIGQSILTQTKTPSASITIPTSWPSNRYDLVWIFDRSNGEGPVTSFSILAQMLLAGDGPAPPIG